MKIRPGHRDDVVAILTGGADAPRAAGCVYYLTGVTNTDDVTTRVTEVGESKELHDESLKLPETRAASF